MALTVSLGIGQPLHLESGLVREDVEVRHTSDGVRPFAVRVHGVDRLLLVGERTKFTLNGHDVEVWVHHAGSPRYPFQVTVHAPREVVIHRRDEAKVEP